MHDFKIGDTVWMTEIHADYARSQFGGYMGPFVIIRFAINTGGKLARLRKPGGPELESGAFLYRLKHDAFMRAVREAVEYEA